MVFKLIIKILLLVGCVKIVWEVSSYMVDCLCDALLDTIKLLPYLFITFLVLELIEHKLSKKTQKVITKYKNVGPIVGGILGGFPQCGFSAMASNLYTSRVITMGTLIAIFLSTSDEMLPVMLGEDVPILLIIKIIVFKIIVGIMVGLLVDLIFKNKTGSNSIKDLCEEEDCHCKNGLFLSSIIHTFKTAIFVLIANLFINIVIYYIGIDKLYNMLNGSNIFVYFLSSLIGLIPNCAASIILTEVYVSGLVPMGIAISGLLTGSGIGILLLFKSNNSLKENLTILSIVYTVGVVIGIIIDFI